MRTRAAISSITTATTGAAFLFAVALSAAPDIAFQEWGHEPAGEVTRTDRLINTHDCWTGEAPGDIIPGHAVYTLPGQVARYGPSDVGFGIWLDGDPGTLHAFCP